MIKLNNKVVLITGASSGIGKAAAIEFAKNGASVILAARREDRLQEACNQIEAAGGKCAYVCADVTIEADVIRMFDEATEKFGHVDILVNNAGCGLKSRIVDIQADQWDNVIAVNLRSVFLCSREAMRRMSENDIWGHIITVCSVAGLYGVGTFAGYCAAKHGVTGFMRSCGWEARKMGIKASTIFPMRVDTEFFNDYTQKPKKREMLSPKDIAADIVAVASRCPVCITKVRLRNLCKRIASLFHR